MKFKNMSLLFGVIFILAFGITAGGLITMNQLGLAPDTLLPKPILASLLIVPFAGIVAAISFELFSMERKKLKKEV
ncbi:hypothetical protein [Pseudoalteromonas sp. Of11M-6]|uniref:hypothetical protein n=1 Tax=Pseudoalteromonas sp. Of11M-6 TaxID=2917754 RepID=UPI001EF59539|nr:hypothetical protein [Pseudoalteromonas sp. Of11M-6]MCG7556077.1 hypothetical protein [Pseudoalteromonas sp. Of11M-6]